MASVSLHRPNAASAEFAAQGGVHRVTFRRTPRWRFAATGVGCAVAMATLARLMSYIPDRVEELYANGIGARISQALSTLTGVAPFSFAELLIAFVVLWLLAPAIPVVYAVLARRRGVRNAVACGAARTAGFMGFLVAIFYLCWGFNYSRAALPLRIGWDDSGLAALPRMGTREDRDELVALCTQLVFITNHYYTVATGTPEAEGRSELKATVAEIDEALETGFARAARLLDLDPSFAQTRGPAKAVLASRLMSRLGVAGFYSPWTGEANYNYELPPFQLPLTIAHEKAHQRCVSSEDEANFFGFLACALSDNPYTRYSGYLFAQRQLLNELIRIDPAAARALIALRCKGVQSDVLYSKFFWRIFGGRAQDLGRAVNDAYLKANRVDAGMLSYQMSARLLVLFSRQYDGTCVVSSD
ncbi:MAG: DUF3810 domain-containing protein [Candidatus Hydrogenedentes bacterium]|nr:DUF3810 domain-containing protein [Candidatus Hydrogenedentota bacterium]